MLITPFLTGVTTALVIVKLIGATGIHRLDCKPVLQLMWVSDLHEARPPRSQPVTYPGTSVTAQCYADNLSLQITLISSQASCYKMHSSDKLIIMMP